MTQNEFTRLMSIVKSGYRSSWMDNDEIVTAFYNFCLQFDFDTCKTAIIDLIEYGNGDQPVTMAVIERKIEREAQIRKKRKPDAQGGRECPVCHGKGYTMKTYPTGVDYVRPCECAVGRDMFPSYFWTADDEEEYWSDQQRHGISRPQYMRAPYEEHRNAKYDEKRTKVFSEVLEKARNNGGRH